MLPIDKRLIFYYESNIRQFSNCLYEFFCVELNSYFCNFLFSICLYSFFEKKNWSRRKVLFEVLWRQGLDCNIAKESVELSSFFDLHLQYWDIIYNMSTCLFFKSRFSFFASKGWKERGKLARGKQEKREGKAWYLYMSTNDIINVCTIIQNITIYI